MAHDVIMMVTQNDELVRQDWERRRRGSTSYRASRTMSDEVIDVQLRVRPLEVVRGEHARHLRGRKVTEIIAVIAS